MKFNINWNTIVSDDKYLYHLYLFKKYYTKYNFKVIKINKKTDINQRNLKIKLIGFQKFFKPFFYTDVDIFIEYPLLNIFFEKIKKYKTKNFFLNTLKIINNNRVPCSIFYIYDIDNFKKFVFNSLKESNDFIQKSYSEKYLFRDVFFSNSIDFFELANFSYVIIDNLNHITKEKLKIFKKIFSNENLKIFKKNLSFYHGSAVAFLIQDFSKDKIIRIE